MLAEAAPTKKCFVALIRHGERADYAHGKTSAVFDIDHDPPLTDKGVKQARETGVSLKKFLAEEGYQEVIIECSPFLRTMMTAAHIAKGLGHTKIRVNYLFSELMASDLFWEPPLPSSALKTKEKKHLIEKYLDGIEVEDTETFFEHAKGLYPETRPEGRQRIELMKSEFKKMYGKAEKKVAHLAVTHGFFVNKFALSLNGVQSYSEYCSISGAWIEGETATLALDSYCEHVQTW